MAWTTALAGIASWTYISVFPGSSQTKKSYIEFPTSEKDKQTVSDVLAFLELKLNLLNQVYASFSKTWNAATEYTKDPIQSKYNTLVSYVKFQQKEINDLSRQNHPLSQTLREKVANTPISTENLAVLYDIVEVDVRELSERLAFLLVLLDPAMPFDRENRERWLSTMREAHRQSVLNLSYAVCEFLLPINRTELREFRTNVLPKLTEFESAAFDFNLDETQLKQLQNATEHKRDSLGDELARVVGELNIKAQVLKDHVNKMKMNLREQESK